MIKVMWFVRRAEHLTHDEFVDWWLNTHAPDIRDEQIPHLVRYVVNAAIEDNLVAKPGTEPLWDGIAEEWFATEAEFNAVYGRTDRDAHDDADANTSVVERLVVREITFV